MLLVKTPRRFMDVFSRPIKKTHRVGAESTASSGLLAKASQLQPHDACAKLESALEGLSSAEAAIRLKKFGPNLVARERKATIAEELWSRARDPLNALLLSLAAVSYFLGDVRAAVVIAAMVVLAITTAFIQEHRSNEAAAKLRAMVHTTASVRRSPYQSDDAFTEVPMDSWREIRQLTSETGVAVQDPKTGQEIRYSLLTMNGDQIAGKWL